MTRPLTSPDEVNKEVISDVKRACEEIKDIEKETEKVHLQIEHAVRLTQEKEQARKKVLQDKE